MGYFWEDAIHGTLSGIDYFTLRGGIDRRQSADSMPGGLRKSHRRFADRRTPAPQDHFTTVTADAQRENPRLKP